MPGKGRVLWPAVLTALGLVCIGLVQLGFNIVVGRVHGPAVLGDVNLALALALFVSTLVSSSFVPANTKYVAEYRGREDEDYARTAFGLSLVIVVAAGVVLALLLHAYLPRIAILLQPILPNLAARVGVQRDLFAAALPLVLLHPLYLLTRGMYYATERVERYLRLEVCTAVGFFLLLAAVIAQKGPLPLPFVIAYALFAAVAVGHHRDRLGLVRERARAVLGDLSHFALRNAAGQFSMMAKIRLGVILASSFLAMEQAGLYAAAFALQSIFYFIPRSLNAVLAPAVSFSYGSRNEGRVERILTEATRLTATAILLLGGVSYIAAPLVLGLVYSAPFAAAAPAFRYLLLATLASVIAQPAINTLGSTEHIHITGMGGIIGLSTSLVAWYFLLPGGGIEGIALGFFLGSLANALIGIGFVSRVFTFSPRVLVRPLVAGGAALLIGMTVSSPGAGGQLAGAGLFTALYLAANWQELSELALRVSTVVRERLSGDAP